MRCPLFKGDKWVAQKLYHQRHKNDPKYCAKRYEHKKKWRKTKNGRASINRSVKKYRIKNLDKVKEIERRSHQKHKEKRNAYMREYRKKKKLINKMECIN